MIVLMDADAGEIQVKDLIDAEMFGTLAGVKRLTIHAYKKRPEESGLPEPVLYAAGAPLWTLKQATEWIENRKGQGTGSWAGRQRSA